MWVERSDGFVADEFSISEWAPLKAFDIGWIPEGWKKGEELDVHNLRGPYVVAIIMQAPKPYDPSIDVMELFMLNVGAGEMDRANAWLEWWRLTEPKT